MTDFSAAERSQIYTELSEATSTRTAEVLMQRILEAPWDNLVTKDHLDAQLSKIDAQFTNLRSEMYARFDLVDAKADARFAQQDAKFERAIRKQLIWTISAMFTFNALLAAWITAFH